MEESITLKDFLGFYKKTMEMGPVDAGTYSPLVLAYIGDAVYEVVVRSILVGRGNAQANRLHKEASTLVNAGAQSASLERIREELTEEEMQVFKRGRNATPHTYPKGATRQEYQIATGLEALFGWLYLQGETARLNTLFETMMEGEV